MAGTLENVRFLIVDDNAHMLDIVKIILRGFGAQYVFEAKDPASFLAFLSSLPGVEIRAGVKGAHIVSRRAPQ